MEATHEIWRYLLLLFVGAVSGFINVIGGGGSMVILPVLMGLGMPATIANGTNRVSIFCQDIAATIKFIKAKKLPLRTSLLLSIPTVVGAAAGAMFASKMTQTILNYVILIILISMIIYILFKPPTTKCTAPCKEQPRIGILTYILFFIVGVYAGFIQVGATLIWYVLLTWRLKMGVISANAAKLFLNFVMTPIALIIFIIHHQVMLIDGLFIGIGSFIGAWLCAKISMQMSAKLIKSIMLIIFISATVYVLLFKILHIKL
ncbi:MAG: sulfite exporter TauE/SafE family protein [Marinifilaceae bacterium]